MTLRLLRLLLLMLLLLTAPDPAAAAAKKKKKSKRKRDAGPANQLNTHTPLSLQIGVGSAGEQSELKLKLPPEKGLTISSPQQLMKHVGHAWDTVVAPHQAGLADAKAGHLTAAPLTDGEAWHHYQAGQAGVIDSARFLVAFSVVPSLQQGGGGPLHAAAARGLVDTVRELLETDDGREGEGVHARAADGTTPLHAAAATGHAAVVSLLLEAGADPQAVGKSGATALHAAAAMGHGEVVTALLAGGTTLVDEAHAFAGCTALHFAAEMGHVDVVTALCGAGADADARKSTGGTPLHTAADCDQPRVVAALLAPPCGASPTKLLNGDTTPLYLAAQRGFARTAGALIDGGADVNFAMPNAVQSRQLAVPGALEMGAGGWYGAKNTERGNGATALHAAVENGHRETARLLVARGARQTGSMEGATPLIIALQYGHPAIALDLARAAPTPDLDARVPVDGSCALFVAAGSGYDDVVSALLRLGARPDTTNKHGATPLSHAAFRGRLGALRLLLEGGADANAGAPLHAALGKGGGLSGAALATAVRALVGAGARADGVSLSMAAEAGEAEAAAALLDAPGGGARADGHGSGGGTPPLLKAAASGHAELVRVLVSRGADANAAGGAKMYGAGALYLAAQGGHLSACRALLEAGAAVDPRLDEIGITPLFVAAERGAAAVVRLLLESGGATEVANWNGVTPLHMAAMRGHVGVVAALSAAGASLEAPAADGATPLLSVAAAAEPLEAAPRRAMLRWLLQRGASSAARDGAGRSALHAAAAAGLVEAVEELLAASGARAAAAALAGATDAEGRTPLTLAVSAGHSAAAEALVRGGAPCGEAELEAARQTRDSEVLKLVSSACEAG